MVYLEHFHFGQPPFGDSGIPEFFFPDSRRGKLSQFLIADTLSGKKFLKLVGEEGGGKTFFCSSLKGHFPVWYRVVLWTCLAGPFDDLLRIACNELAPEEIKISSKEDLLAQWRQIRAEQHAQGIGLVLIIDEAEKMFAATLERLLRLVTEDVQDAHFTLLLVGRPELDAQLAQMAAMGTEVHFDASYQLEPFSESDTRQYIRHRCTVAGMSSEHFAEVFTEPVLSTIVATAQGNARLINTLAEEALKNFCTEKSFMVLLDRVEPEAIEEPVPVNRVVEFYELLLEHKRLTGAVAVVFLLILGVGIFLFSAGNRSAMPPLFNAPPAALAPPTLPGNTPTRLSSRDQRDGEALFRERLKASAGWLAGMYKGGYTIQLMMLASTSAEYSLSETLVEDDYYPLRDQFYILRKLSNPPTLFVFYGVYDSLEAAREARNSMPVFLRKHHPYPLAISEAMRKIEQ